MGEFFGGFSDPNQVPLSGWLYPDGTYEEVGYMQHGYWADRKCEELGLEYGISGTDVLRDHGYIQISDGYAFLHNSKKFRRIELADSQLSFLITHCAQLDKDTNRNLQEY